MIKKSKKLSKKGMPLRVIRKRTPMQNRASTKTSDAMSILARDMSGDAKLGGLVAEASINAEVAQLIYDARTAAGLTQQQLAAAIGTTQSVIARLEDADYDGHSLTMLQRIANALNKGLEIHFTSTRQQIAPRT